MSKVWTVAYNLLYLIHKQTDNNSAMTTLNAKQNRRYQLVVLTLAGIRADLKMHKLTGVVADYATDLYEMKELEAKYAQRAYDLRNGL